MRLTTGRREFNPKDGQVELSNFQANERVAKCYNLVLDDGYKNLDNNSSCLLFKADQEFFISSN